MASSGYVKIYSNDGATLLFTSTNSYSVTDTITITETGVTLTNETYTYSGDKKFLGLSRSANSTEATDFAVGHSSAISDFTFYIVEGNSNNITDLTNTTWYVPSGWQVERGYGLFNIVYDNAPHILSSSQNYQTLGIGYSRNQDVWTISSYKLTMADSANNSSGVVYYDTGATDLHIAIKGGTDATNPALISWLTTYGIQLKVTDLTNTTWTVNAGWEAEAGYGEFEINGNIPSSKDLVEYFYIGYDYPEPEIMPTDNYCTLAEDHSMALGEFYKDESFSISIISGTDTTNPKLIAWLSKWGELRLTDLKGTTWEYTVQSVVPKGTMTHTDGYSVSGTINSTPFSGISSQVVDLSNNLDDGLNFESVTLFPNGVVPLGTVGNVYHIKFTAGDTTNTSLISWMYDNCTLVSINEEEEPDTPEIPTTPHGEIYYKGELVTTLVEGEFIVLHTKDFKFLGDIVIKNVGEVEEETPTLISFTIGENFDTVLNTYQAVEGMTWADWVANTNYNTDGYEIASDSTVIKTSGGTILRPDSMGGGNVYATDKIVSGVTYSLYVGGGV